MISIFKFVAMAVTILICFGLPIFLGYTMEKKYKFKAKLITKGIVVGVMVFVISQLVLRSNILNFLSKTQWYGEMARNPILISLFLGLTAGIFEEVGRYIGFRYFMKNSLNWEDGVAFGIGHGGVEAILLVGFTYINNIIYSIMINLGVYDTLVGSKLPNGLGEQLYDQLVNSQSTDFLVGGIERIFAITIQIALSIVVLYGVRKKNFLYLLLAILLHGVVDSPLVYMMIKGVSIMWCEAFVFVCALAGLLFIFKTRKNSDSKVTVENIN